ncbi:MULTISPECIES: hypothetical protein [unclassified Bradyrhizobium]|uniref:hypothetical protein n=1 Tax=unclassified Bradyrhizobium TaxID=2631580 RepID=UPI0028E535C9|nr:MULTISPECIES: hypothetical protein [unclassified Bradyrhizobium]
MAKNKTWTPASPEDVQKMKAQWEEREKAHTNFLDKNPEVIDRLHGRCDDSFDPLEHAVWERHERIAAACAIVEQLRILPVEEAALKLLGMFDALRPLGNEEPQKAGRPKRSMWDDIDKEIGPADKRGSHYQAADERADQRRRKKLGLERPPGRPKTRQK